MIEYTFAIQFQTLTGEGITQRVIRSTDEHTVGIVEAADEARKQVEHEGCYIVKVTTVDIR